MPKRAEDKIAVFLSRADPLADRKAFVASITDEERGFYAALIARMRSETSDSMSEAEYEQLAVIRLWLDRFDAWQAGLRDESGNPSPERVPANLAEVARKYRAMLLEAFRTERQMAGSKSDVLDRVKKIVLQWETEGGGKVKIEATKGRVMDAEVVTDADGGKNSAHP